MIWAEHRKDARAQKTQLNQGITLRNCFRIRALSCVRGSLFAFLAWTSSIWWRKERCGYHFNQPADILSPRKTLRVPLTSIIIGQISAFQPRNANETGLCNGQNFLEWCLIFWDQSALAESTTIDVDKHCKKYWMFSFCLGTQSLFNPLFDHRSKCFIRFNPNDF